MSGHKYEVGTVRRSLKNAWKGWNAGDPKFLRLKIALTICRVLLMAVMLVFSFLNVEKGVLDLKFRLETQRLIDRSLAALAIVHSTQRERGFTGIYLENPTVTNTLLGYRSALNGAVDSYCSSSADDSSGAICDEGMTNIRLLRLRVDNGSVDFVTSFDMYTNFVDLVLKTALKLSLATHTADELRDIFSYVDIAHYKEFAAQERGWMSPIFTVGRFERVEYYSRFTSILAKEETYLELFRAVSDSSLVSALDSVLASPVIAVCNEYRDIALAGLNAPSLGVNSQIWWANQTTRQDLLQSVLSQSIDEARSNILSKYPEALRSVLFIILGAFATLISVCLMTWDVYVSWRRSRHVLSPSMTSPRPVTVASPTNHSLKICRSSPAPETFRKYLVYPESESEKVEV